MKYLLLLAFFVLSSATFTCPGVGFFANPDKSKCDSFYQCDESLNPYFQTCPWPLVWRDSLKRCDGRIETDCLENMAYCPGPGPQWNYFDCTTYFLCDHGVGSVMKCPPGLLFNPTLRVCDWPWNVECLTDLCQTDPLTAWTFFENPGKGILDCSTPDKIWRDQPYKYDVTGRTFGFCYGYQPILAYCCGNAHYVKDHFCQLN